MVLCPLLSDLNQLTLPLSCLPKGRDTSIKTTHASALTHDYAFADACSKTVLQCLA